MPGRGPIKDEVVAVFRRQAAQQIDGVLRERDAVLLARLHAARRNSPKLFGEVDFAPAGTDRLAGAGAGVDGELERFRSHAFALSQLYQEARYVAVG